jgi:ParB family chromosome partitioning protein
MTKTAKITSTYEQIEFADTYVSDLNPRTVINDDSIAALAENIRQLGLIHPLAGLIDAEGRTGIVAGGRRHRALALLQDDPRFNTVPVHMAPDEATARAWAASENNVREDLNPADEIREFGAMHERGIPVASIAVAFGVTEPHVYRRLALANLPAAVLDALQVGKINIGQAKAFTISDDEPLTLEVLQFAIAQNERGYGVSDHIIKSRLKPDSVSSNDRRAVFVTLEAYKEAGGTVSSDLFAEKSLLNDPALLDTLFAATLEETCKEYAAANGWKWAEAVHETYIPWDYTQNANMGRIYPVEGVLTEAEAERYDELADLANGDVLDEEGQAELDALEAKQEGDYTPEQRALAGVILTVDSNGQLQASNGMVRGEDRAEAEAAGIIAPNQHQPTEKAPKAAISDKLRMDLGRIETGARQNALLDDPKLALHLLAFQLCGKMGYDRAYGIRMDEVPNVPETETGYTLDKRLTTPERDDRSPFDRDHAAEFAKFRKRGDAKIMDLLNRYLVSQLSVGDADLGGMIDKLTGKKTRETFTPNAENFFGRVGGPYLVTLWADLLGLAEDHPTVTSFDKLKKGEKADKLESLFADEATRTALGLTAEQQNRIAAWLPEGMA